MFTVLITTEAKPLIESGLAAVDGLRPGVMIHRQGPVGDVTRTPKGDAQWKVEHPHPWKLRFGSFETIPDDSSDVQVVDGIRVWLPLIPRPNEKGVVVTVKDGQLHVVANDA